MKGKKFDGSLKHISCLLFIFVSVALGSAVMFWYDQILGLINSSNYQTLPQHFTPLFTISFFESKDPSFICSRSVFLHNKSLSQDSFVVRRAQVLKKYCSIVPIPRKNWTKARRYSERDVAFLIFTATKFYHSRATAVRDTWLSRVSNYYVIGETPYHSLPVTVIVGAGSGYLSNMKKHFYGLQIIYRKQQAKPDSERQKWFYFAAGDMFVNVEHTIKRLDPFDHTQPLLIAGRTMQQTCIDTITNKTHPVIFPLGQAGFLFSFKLLELMQPHLTEYVEEIWPRDSPASDVALACLAFKLGINVTKMPGFWAIDNPAKTLSVDGSALFHSDPEPNIYHYISPDEMYDLDEFYVHQYVDRLINDANWLEMANFARLFISSHYELLAIKRKECTLPPVNQSALSR